MKTVLVHEKRSPSRRLSRGWLIGLVLIALLALGLGLLDLVESYSLPL